MILIHYLVIYIFNLFVFSQDHFKMIIHNNINLNYFKGALNLLFRLINISISFLKLSIIFSIHKFHYFFILIKFNNYNLHYLNFLVVLKYMHSGFIIFIHITLIHNLIQQSTLTFTKKANFTIMINCFLNQIFNYQLLIIYYLIQYFKYLFVNFIIIIICFNLSVFDFNFFILLIVNLNYLFILYIVRNFIQIILYLVSILVFILINYLICSIPYHYISINYTNILFLFTNYIFYFHNND